MLPTVAVANDGARALLLFTLASAARAGLEDPCKYTPDGFERTRSPCGENGICSVASSWNELAPHQRSFNCTCLGNYIGDRCERCDHGYTFESGCEDKMREHEGTGFVVWASIIGAILMIVSIVALAVGFHAKITDDPGILFSEMVRAGDDQIVLMRSAPRSARKQDDCCHCRARKQPDTAADCEARNKKGKKLQP